MRIRILSLLVILSVFTVYGCAPKESAPPAGNRESASQSAPGGSGFDGEPLPEGAGNGSSAGQQSGGEEEPAAWIQDMPDMLQGKTPDDIAAGMDDGEYVVYYGEAWEGLDTKNLTLLEEWIGKYRQGEPGVVCLLHDGRGFPNGMSFLECNGSDSYAVYHYDHGGGTWISCTSSVLLKREVDYVFASDLPAEEWYENWQTMIVRHSPVNRTMLDGYDVDAASPLGEITPEQAGEIAVYRYMQFSTYRKANKTGSFFGAGQFFPLDTEPLPAGELFPNVEADLRPELWGAARVNGHPCYIIGIAVTPEQTGEGNLFLVNADGGHLVFEISAVDGSYRLFADANQERIVPRAGLQTGITNRPAGD